MSHCWSIIPRQMRLDDLPEPPTPPFSLVRCEEDRLLVMGGPFAITMADVIRKEDGTIGWIRASGRIHGRAE